MAYERQLGKLTEMKVGLENALTGLRDLRPETLSSDHARNLAVTITEMEKVVAYYDVFVYTGAVIIKKTHDDHLVDGVPGTAKLTLPNA